MRTEYLTKGDNEYEYKIILRTIFVALLIIEDKSDIILGINKNALKLLQDFIKNLNFRKNLDSDFFIELNFIKEYMKDKEMEFIISEEHERNWMLKEAGEIKENLEYFKIIEDALIVNEYNLYWKKHLIMGKNVRKLFGRTN